MTRYTSAWKTHLIWKKLHREAEVFHLSAQWGKQEAHFVASAALRLSSTFLFPPSSIHTVPLWNFLLGSPLSPSPCRTTLPIVRVHRQGHEPANTRPTAGSVMAQEVGGCWPMGQRFPWSSYLIRGGGVIHEETNPDYCDCLCCSTHHFNSGGNANRPGQSFRFVSTTS